MKKSKKRAVQPNYLRSDIIYIIITIINLLIVSYFFKLNPDLYHSGPISYNTNDWFYSFDNAIKYLPFLDIFLSLMLSIGLGVNILYCSNKLLKINTKKYDSCTLGYYLGILSPVMFVITFYLFVNLNMPYNYVSFISPKFLCFGLYFISNIIVILLFTSNLFKNNKKNSK